MYTGLVVAPANDPCAGELKSADGLCTHGPDAAPDGVDIHKSVPPVVPATAPTPGPTGGSSPSPATTDLPQGTAAWDIRTLPGQGGSTPSPSKTPTGTGSPTPSPSKTPTGTEVVCDGDGTTGNRVQVLYVHGPDHDRFADYRDSIKHWAADVDVIYRASAEQTGGNRHVRYVTDSNCTASVLDVEVSAAALGNWSAANGEVVDKGFNRRDRKYMMFTDAQVYCGLGSFANDDRAGQDNPSNFGPSYARIDSGCWGAHAAAHELGHNLGAVSNSAPDSSGRSHCTVNWDLMCYPDGGGKPMTTKCSDFLNRDRLDCTKDDYFNTDPKPGSYLASHWNVANNQFLIADAHALPEISIRQLTATEVDFGWGKAEGAKGYRLVINGQAGALIPAGPYSNSTVMPGLTPNTDYTLAIEVVDANGKSSAPGRATSFHTPRG
ncbi:RICIN domain-containing protein [Kitasatospora sp. NPDC001683]